MKGSNILIPGLLLLNSLLLFTFQSTYAQCTPGLVKGQNLVTNGDFSQGYSGWTYTSPDYTAYTPCSGCYSVPGKIYAASNPVNFNSAFTNFSDHSPGSDNMMLMVDGVCNNGIKLWSQSVAIQPNTAYYFEVYVASMSTKSPYGTLQFDINGVNLPTTITPDGTIGNWIYYSATWNSGPSPPANATISIENTTTTGCNSAVDFAIDDISFTPGCAFASPGPVPNLGPDLTLCGTGGITLDANIPHNSTTTVSWFKGTSTTPITTGTGLSAPYQYFVSNTAASAGTYTVCVKDGASCEKTDIINISNTYSIDLGPPFTLCNPITATLDAKYTGPGVTYQWYKNGQTNADTVRNGKGKTYTVNSAGTYYVKVTDPACGVQWGSVVISSNAPTPINTTFCGTAHKGNGLATFKVSGTGTYYWYNSPTASNGSYIATGTSYSPPALAGPGPYTFYVQDSTPAKLTVGPPATGNGFTNIAGGGTGPTQTTNTLIFNAASPFTIDTITVIPYVYSCPTSGTAYNINFKVNNAAGAVTGTSTYAVPASQCVVGNATTGLSTPIKVPVGITVQPGSGYKLSLNTGSANIALYLNTTNSGAIPTPELYHYPTTYASTVTFASNDAASFNLYYSPDAIPGYFDWKITKYSSCQRIPVIATESCPLPVTFIGLEVTDAGSKTLISWQTGTEKNSSLYEIERSFDGLNFTSIGTRPAAGNSNMVQTYAFYDEHPCESTCYYRIKEYDVDGSVYSSDIKAVSRTGTLNIQLNPNPNQGIFHLDIQSSEKKPLDITVYNQLGQTVHKERFQPEAEFTAKDINVAEIPSGIYIVEVQSDSNKWMRKFLKN